MASDDIAKAVKDARIAAAFSFTCVILIGLLFMVDGRRNKWIADRVDEIRALIGEFRVMAVSTYAGPGPQETTAAGVGGVVADRGDGGGESGADLVAASPAGAGQPADGGEVARSANGQFARRTSAPGGPRGDG